MCLKKSILFGCILIFIGGCATATSSPIPTFTPVPTATKTPSPEPSPTSRLPTPTPPSPTAMAIPLFSCGDKFELVDSSQTADLIWERVIPYLEELEICDAKASIEIIDGEVVGEEITGGGEPAGAHTWCYWTGNVGTSTETILAVGYPNWDQWWTYLQGWTTVGERMYPSEVLLHELYHVRQCLVTGEIVGEGNWTVDPDEYLADTFALERLQKLQAASIISYVD